MTEGDGSCEAPTDPVSVCDAVQDGVWDTVAVCVGDVVHVSEGVLVRDVVCDAVAAAVGDDVDDPVSEAVWEAVDAGDGEPDDVRVVDALWDGVASDDAVPLEVTVGVRVGEGVVEGEPDIVGVANCDCEEVLVSDGVCVNELL